MTGDIISQLGGRHTLEKALTDNLKWIIKSFAHNKNLGSSGWSNILGQFSRPYPETTGYLIPTLIASSQYLADISYLSIAKNQINFFSSITNKNGSYYQSIGNKKPIVFDTSQILLGLCKLYEHEPDPNVADQITINLKWLLSVINKEGRFTNNNFTEQNCPAYYSRVFWAMLLASKICGNNQHAAISAGIDYIIEQRNSNNSFSQWGFDNEAFVLTHNIVYTLRGLYETALITDNDALLSIVENCIDTVVSTLISDNKLYGAYNQQWKADRSFVCSVGNAQFAYLMLTINSEKYSKAITIVLQPILRMQSKIGPNKGAVQSSLPIWGKYQRWKYTNWTQKFFCDALITLLNQ